MYLPDDMMMMMMMMMIMMTTMTLYGWKYVAGT
jgi:hypothetical protein